MEKIQYIYFLDNEIQDQNDHIYINIDQKDTKSIHFCEYNNSEPLNEFDINFIDLNTSVMWNQTSQLSNRNVNIKNESYFKELNVNIKSLKNTKVIFLLPQDFIHYYFTFVDDPLDLFKYNNKTIRNNKNIIEEQLYIMLEKRIQIEYEGNNKTKIFDNYYKSDFYFSGDLDGFDIISKSRSDKPTMISINKNIILSTLVFKEIDNIYSFIGLFNTIPTWVNEIKCLDDDKIKDKLQNIQNQLAILNNMKRKNDYYKSILYENSYNLEEVVIKIFKEILEIDDFDFTDMKKEDFFIDLGSFSLIGEVKGTKNTLKENYVMQLIKHRDDYLRSHDLNDNQIKSILVINHERYSKPENRSSFPEKPMELAENNNILIITTIQLIEILEKYRNKKLDCNVIKQMIIEQKGLLNLK